MFRRLYLDKQMKNFLFDRKSNLSELKLKNLKAYDKSIKNLFFSKDTVIPKSLVGYRIFVHNGKGIASLKITSGMLGFKLSEFFLFYKNNQRKGKK